MRFEPASLGTKYSLCVAHRTYWCSNCGCRSCSSRYLSCRGAHTLHKTVAAAAEVVAMAMAAAAVAMAMAAAAEILAEHQQM